MRLKNKACESGAVLVELAFTLPILALIILVIIDLGLMVRQHQLIQNAAREGARYSSILDSLTTDAAIRQRVIDYCSQEKINIGGCTIGVNRQYPIPLPSGKTASGSRVTVNCTNQAMLLKGIPLLPMSSMNIQGSAVFRNLY